MDRKLSRKTPKRKTSILSYWTLQYFLILCIGFIIIVAGALYWIRTTSLEKGLKTAELLGLEIAEKVSGTENKLHIPPDLDRLVDKRTKLFNTDNHFCIMILDNNNQLIYSNPKMTQQEVYTRLSDDLSEPRNHKFAGVTVNVVDADQTLGKVWVLQSKKAITYSPDTLLIVGLLFAALILCGWFTIYLLSRKLSKPIRQVAHAAEQIRTGNYDVNLNLDTREQEMNELVHSFREMSLRLQQLEEWRNLSLAGVTHELKTPVTSIKGLVMAVRDDIVSPQEGKEFLDIALKESERMERMVADLLDYNAMSAGSVAVRHERVDLSLLVGEIIYQWKIAYEDQSPEVAMHVPAGALYTIGDALRIQQIIVNLLNNGLQATASGQTALFDIRLRAEEHDLYVDVQDNGTGIAEEDQSKIFERFYRGELKKRRSRGLGLGLTYSRLLAQAQGGDLTLTSSSPKGSLFTLKLPRWKTPDATTPEKAYRSPVNA
ncbi:MULTISPECIES: HAMP domain-containing sensor histidine kinase [Paenibacillus]|uniref:HAMP domain-containing sensor histidine kinase n=1 Tax=Paenibacillus TaxID=44249 RepID=UPI00129D71F1|nr:MULTISPECIES: HAMP domain-containing sensor histidine kinase [Paenibacillus]MCM3207772.1 HAMP domain-containing histidine kinase [Paenibacillus illinoisensis]WJH28775.1 HAMP domain-containing histidine kinase [Paenibacillus sp. CC-CFT742]